MKLYNEKGEIEFFDLEEVRRMLQNHNEFEIRKQAFIKDPSAYAFSFLNDIDSMRRIPLEFRKILPNYFKIGDKDLDTLEENAKKYVPKELLVRR